MLVTDEPKIMVKTTAETCCGSGRLGPRAGTSAGPRATATHGMRKLQQRRAASSQEQS